MNSTHIYRDAVKEKFIDCTGPMYIHTHLYKDYKNKNIKNNKNAFFCRRHIKILLLKVHAKRNNKIKIIVK